MIYLYDGTYYGLLTCIYNHYYQEAVSEIYSISNYMGSLIDASKFIETKEAKAEKVERAIRDKFTPVGYRDMYQAFLSDEVYKDCYILSYIINGFTIGAAIDRLYSAPYVIKVRELSRRVGFEAHRFKGLLRFIDKKAFLYASFEPDNDILALIGDHFADRYLNERIIIHDLKRQKALVAYGGKWMLHDIETEHILKMIGQEEVDQTEELLQVLWKGYFDHIGIEGRRNLQLQQSFVPLKYRKHILEFK